LRRIDHAILVFRLAVDRLQRALLRVVQPRQRRHVHLALPRILHQAIFDAVDGVALFDDLGFHALEDLIAEERRRHIARIGERRLNVLDELRADADEVVRRRAGDDAVEVVGIALRFHQRLTSAVRAA